MNDVAHLVNSVVWITGFSGSGKTTVARLLGARLSSTGLRPVRLDGDVMRAVLARENSFSKEGRLELAGIYARLCREVSGQGIPVICATISMFHAVRAWNRANIPSYYEIYLRVPLDQREARDPKGLYSANKDDGARMMAGRDEPSEEPSSPNLTIDNWGATSAEHAVDAIWRLISKASH